MFKKVSLILLFLVSLNSYADWGAPKSEITTLYIYPNYAVVIQNNASPYAGTANCKNNTAFSFNWADFNEQVANRIYSTLMAAYMSKKPIRAVLAGSGCGPEGHKKASGYFEL